MFSWFCSRDFVKTFHETSIFNAEWWFLESFLDQNVMLLLMNLLIKSKMLRRFLVTHVGWMKIGLGLLQDFTPPGHSRDIPQNGADWFGRAWQEVGLKIEEVDRFEQGLEWIWGRTFAGSGLGGRLAWTLTLREELSKIEQAWYDLDNFKDNLWISQNKSLKLFAG